MDAFREPDIPLSITRDAHHKQTKEGYKGLMVITEYVSKYPYVVSIKSKSFLLV